MSRIHERLLLLALHATALIVMAVLLWFCFVGENRSLHYWFTVVISGKWAIRYLLLCLLMTPLNTLLGWRQAIKFRKPAGLWAFAFAAFHFAIYLSKMKLFWFDRPISGIDTALGFISLCILTALAVTSMRDSMKRLGRWWKPLHRLVYVAGVLAIVHALLESSNQRVISYEPDMRTEAVVYLVLLAVLLVARVPMVLTLIRKS